MMLELGLRKKINIFIIPVWYNSDMNIRSMQLTDYPQVLRFWKEHYKVSSRDTKENIEVLLTKNPDISILAEEEGEIVGTALGSFDGRKGYVQKIAVAASKRGSGLGKELVSELINNLKRAGSHDIRVSCREELIPFYQKCGFELKEGLFQLQIKL